MRKNLLFLLVILTMAAPAGLLAQAAPPAAKAQSGEMLKDYSFGYWLNGWRKQADDPSADLLCIESSKFALAIDPAALDKPRFATLSDDLDYASCLDASTRRLAALAPATLLVDVEVGGKTYRMVSCRAGVTKDAGRLKTVRLWESGRWVQHFDVQDLIFKDRDGAILPCGGTLDLLAWPGSLAFTAELTPAAIYQDGMNEGVVGAGLCVIDKPFDIPHQPAIDPEMFTVECWVKCPETLPPGGGGWLLCKNDNEVRDGNFGFLLQGAKPAATLNIGGGKTNRYVISARHSLVADAWNHLALSYDGKTMCFYLNGASQGAIAVDRPRTPGKGLLRLGKRGDNLGTPVKALYDQVRIWKRALPAKEIKQHTIKPSEMAERDGLLFEENFEPKDGGRFEFPSWSDATLHARFTAGGRSWESETPVPGQWKMGQKHAVSIICQVDPLYAPPEDVNVRVETANGQSVAALLDKTKNCHVARIAGLKRAWKTGMTDIRDYDDLLIDIDNKAAQPRMVSLLVELKGPANITGLCPILCDEKGVPTGLPVQLSKNWHYAPTGEYLRAYVRIPAMPGGSRRLLRVIYGFYGNVPSASHAQLCLVGYGGNGRWDQLAIGCWGETFCLDMDMSLVDIAITDVRCLMVRQGADGPRWNWTDGGWGGDWLGVNDRQGRKLCFAGMKTAYLAHGPCLSDVRYNGHYGPNRDVDLQATVHLLRTDDYARTFHRLRYTFQQAMAVDNTWLFKMGRTGGLVTPAIAYGNRDGLCAQRDVPQSLKAGEVLLDATTLAGDGPWWIAFPGALHPNGKMPDGSRALIIRSYKATFAGKTYRQPTIKMPLFAACDVDLLLVAPKEVASYLPGDSVELDVEWITLPRTADDYYGPNEAFRKHLADNPRSWKTVYREAAGNDLKLKVDGGVALSAYPAIIRADKPEVKLEIAGGVGFVPVRFEGLPRATGWALYRVDGRQLTRFDQPAMATTTGRRIMMQDQLRIG